MSSEFFEPILPKRDINISIKNDNNKNKNSFGESKSTYVSLQKEYEEDKELLDLLSSSKRNL